MKLSELTSYLEEIAPLAYQEDYDNSGLIIGDPDAEITSALISLDCTEAVVDEAIEKNCGLIISHHPIVFKGLKKFNGNTYVERVVMKALKHDIALYAIHTNFDHVLDGVNSMICDKLGLKNCTVLSPKTGLLKKLVTFCPLSHAEIVSDALFSAGAGSIGRYSECSFNTEGIGTFKAGSNTDPYVGEKGIRHQESEISIETIYPSSIERKVLQALFQAHPYEEVAYDLYPLSNGFQEVGAGMLGHLDAEMPEADFLQLVKKNLHATVVRHTAVRNKAVRKVAVCGGAGSFLLKQAISAGADVFVTSDYKYHEFFDAEGKIIIADVGHFESEQFTQQLLFDIIRKKFANFALHLTTVNTNPINYLI
ncbi:Nif3-like dinuclear metal center hexameric protein [Desertivirga xinjiangensis]|uniref:Nif3-like dinuclear metal center hexameric protein n=1 Tax=Desertivirga xinjiangensis TaxID=539206 RepID=UPI00210A2EAD|nr:Nif3-like dinuclear metal center hexameric protein [Pedobacter xinjiangensis]